MTTAYTSLLGLALPVTGELSGTWGDVVNNSITSLVDTSVAGTTNISTDANVTLTTTTGASNQARQAILLFSGARTAIRTVTAPAQSKIYTVINATTGGFAVTLVGAGPTTGVTIANGARTVVAWNGSDFVEVSSPSSIILPGGTANGVLYLNGSKVVTSGSALTFDGSNVGVTASSSAGFVGITTQNTSAGAGASSGIGINNDSTASTYLRTYGSGQTNTLLGSVIANYTALLSDGAASNGILLGSLTNKPIIFGVNNAEVGRFTSTGLGIGTSSPAAKVEIFQTSTTTPSLTLRYNSSSVYANHLMNGGGSYVISSPTANGVTSGGLLLQAGESLGFFTNGRATNTTAQARLDASGNFGLGVEPSAWGGSYKAFQLTNSGRSLAATGAGAGDLTLAFNAIYDSTDSRWEYAGTGDAAVRYSQTGAGIHAWYNAAVGTAGNAITFTQAMTLDASGRLVIGGTTAFEKLTVVTGTTYAATFNTTNVSAGTTRISLGGLGGGGGGGGTAGIGAAHNHSVTAQSSLTFYSHDGTTFNEVGRFDPSGNLGVGTTSPAQRLDVSSASTLTRIAITNTANGVNGSGVQFLVLNGGTEASNVTIRADNADNTQFFNKGGERARITSSGQLVVGSTSFNAGIVGFGAAPNGDVYMTRSESTNSFVTNQVYSTGAAVYRFYVGMAGTVYAASTSISAISDQTLKTNIRDLETGLTEVMALKPRRFDWKNGDAENVAGFVAQEVEQVLPELVSDYKYSDTETKKSLKMGDILPTLVKAIQEQQAIIESLKARLDAANL